MFLNDLLIIDGLIFRFSIEYGLRDPKLDNLYRSLKSFNIGPMFYQFNDFRIGLSEYSSGVHVSYKVNNSYFISS